MLCYLYTLPDESLLPFIRDKLKLEKLYRQLSRLNDPNRDQMKYFSALFREGEYYTEEDIREILDQYRLLKNTPYPKQCKALGDMYLMAGRSSMAAFYYKEALKFETLDSEEQGKVYHNMAIAKSRLFRFEDAKVDFLKAYQYGGVEESLFNYFCIVAMSEGLPRAREEIESFEIQDMVRESFENRFAGIREAFRHTGTAAWDKRIRFLMEHGRKEEAEKSREQFAAELKKEFRKELYMDEHLLVTNLPINI
jgi:tetratricopeptide (TPR) repeat protein